MIDVFDRKTATPANEVHFSLYWILYITFIGFRIFSIIRIFRKKIIASLIQSKNALQSFNLFFKIKSQVPC